MTPAVLRAIEGEAPGRDEVADQLAVEAERSCVGAVLNDPTLLGADFMPRAADYEFQDHVEIVLAVAACAARGAVDELAVAEELRSRGHAGITRVQLMALANSIPSRALVKTHAGLVRERARDRRAAAACRRLAQRFASTAPLEEKLTGAQADWDELRDVSAADERARRRPSWVQQLRTWNPEEHDRRVGQVEFVWEGLIANGKTGCMVAGGGTGKTTLKITLAVCGALGRPFLGRSVADGSYVLISNDDPQEDLGEAVARVMDAMGLTDEERTVVRKRVRIHSLQGLEGERAFCEIVGGVPMASDFADHVVAALDGIDDLRLVMFDTLRQFSGGSTNEEEVTKLAIAGCNEIARRLGCATMLSHHTGKSNFRDGVTDMYCGSGSAAIADNSRFVLLLQTTTWSDVEAKMRRTGQESGDPLVLVSTRGSLLVKAAAPTFLVRDGFRISHIEGASMTVEEVLDKRDREVLRAVQAGRQTKNTIAAEVKGRKAAVLDRIDALEARGHIRNGSATGTASYTLTASGSAFLEQAE